LTSEEENNLKEEDTEKISEENILNHPLTKEMKTSYINYAMSVIIGRALPDARDGLKPVHRRVLYGMYEGGHTSDKKFSKSARSVGEVMGKYHPHGDASIYDTMVRMAQDFSLRYPLVDGQGNFGSIDGDPPAAMRYTESRLDKIAKHMLEDIEKKTVDFQPNFDDSESEPTVLPSRLPNLLLNGSDGIAVGMATRMPPHNLTEVSGAVRLHVGKIIEQGVENEIMPNITIEDYMEHIQGPDFPTGAGIHGVDGIYDMYSTGKGRFHVRSKCEVIDDSNGKRIIVHEIPYQVKKADMLVHIAELVSNGTVVGIRDIRDESSKEGIRVMIEVKNNADPYAVLNQLFKSSRLQESYSANMMGILDGRPVLLTLPVILHTYVSHRENVIERRAQFELDKAEARAHVLEGLVKAQERIDDVVAIGKASKSREQFELVLQGKESLIDGIESFDFTILQSRAIAERRLYQLSQLDVNKVQNEFGELKIKIDDLIEIITSRMRRLNILISELEELVEKHGDERRSYIDPMPLSMDREDLIEERAIVITLSEDNYIRHMPAENFRIQNRGGKGLRGVITKEEDTPQMIVTCFSKDRLLIFTDQGRVYGLKAWETPLGSRLSKGGHIRNVLGSLREDENIVSIMPLSKNLIEEPEGNYLFFATHMGLIKKTRLEEYVRINKNGKYALRFKLEGDKLVNVRRFASSNIRSSGRVSAGVWGIKTGSRKGADGGYVVSMIATDDYDTQILTITRNGMAKRSRLGTSERIPFLNVEGTHKKDKKTGELLFRTDGYRRTRPGAKGIYTMHVGEKDAIISAKHIPNLGDNLFLLTKKGMMIRLSARQTKESIGKKSKGTRIMELRNSTKTGFTDSIIFTARLPAELIDAEEE
jgi:DNA gyrase subunit A